MKAILVAWKCLREIMREPQLLALDLALPLIFLLVTIAMYNGPVLVTHAVWLSGPEPERSTLAAELQSFRYVDGRAMFKATLSNDLSAAETALKQKSVAAQVRYAPESSSLTIRGDAVSASFYRASVLLESALRQYSDRIAGNSQLVRVEEQSIAAHPIDASAGPQTLFDLFAPGMIVFTILMIIPQTAMLVAREIRWRTLRRLRLTNLSSWGFLGGISLAQMAVAVVQVLVVFWATLALGFHNQGSIWVAMLVGLAISFSAVGQGLIVACFVENDSQAANIGSTLTMLEVFLSGVMFPLPPMTVFTLAGHGIDLFDIFPATSGFLALQQALAFGVGLRDIAFRLTFCLALSAVYFVAGVFIFQRLQMRAKV